LYTINISTVLFSWMPISISNILSTKIYFRAVLRLCQNKDKDNQNERCVWVSCPFIDLAILGPFWKSISEIKY